MTLTYLKGGETGRIELLEREGRRFQKLYKPL
jgi:hypothetical protein